MIDHGRLGADTKAEPGPALRPSRRVPAAFRRRAALLGCLTVLSSGVSAAPPGAGPPGAGLLPGGSSKEPINIEADRLEYYNKDQKAIYIGNVVVIQGETSMKCSKLTIFINRQSEGQKGQPKPPPTPVAAGAPGGNSVRHMDADGPVTLVSKDQVGTGDRLEYDKPLSKVTISGHVVLTQGTNVTKGDSLVYDLTTGVAQVHSGASAGRVSGYFVPGAASADAGGKPKDDAKPAKRAGGRTASRQRRTE